MSEITGAQSLVRSLEAAGADDIFGIPGGAILPAYAPLMDSSIRHILVRHEQGAGHAAQGYAAATGRVGVCMATSGPGALHLLAGLYDAKMDHVPVVAIVGQQSRMSIGTDYQQEIDLISLYKDVADAYEAHSYRGMLYSLGAGADMLDLANRQWNATRTDRWD